MDTQAIRFSLLFSNGPSQWNHLSPLLKGEATPKSKNSCPVLAWLKDSFDATCLCKPFTNSVGVMFSEKGHVSSLPLVRLRANVPVRGEIHTGSEVPTQGLW